MLIDTGLMPLSPLIGRHESGRNQEACKAAEARALLYWRGEHLISLLNANPTSSKLTRERLGWKPTHMGFSPTSNRPTSFPRFELACNAPT